MNFYRMFFAVPPERLRILLLIDGFGMNLFEKEGHNLWLNEYFFEENRSVYPSTTAVALSSLASLRDPGELGVTGWTTWLPNRKSLIQVLTLEEPEASITNETLLVPSALGKTGVRMVHPRPYLQKPYMGWTTGLGRAKSYGYSIEQENHWARVTEEVVMESKAGELLYVYLPMIDSSSHFDRWDGEKTARILRTIDHNLESLFTALTRWSKSYHIPIEFAITADHGLLNVPPDRYFTLEDTSPWLKHLECSISGEGRNPIFHVRPGREELFYQSFFESPESEHFYLMTPEELIQAGLFGPKGISDAARPRWGTYVGLAHDVVYLEDITQGQKSKNFAAVHGGNHKDERRVPLFQGAIE